MFFVCFWVCQFLIVSDHSDVYVFLSNVTFVVFVSDASDLVFLPMFELLDIFNLSNASMIMNFHNLIRSFCLRPTLSFRHIFCFVSMIILSKDSEFLLNCLFMCANFQFFTDLQLILNWFLTRP